MTGKPTSDAFSSDEGVTAGRVGSRVNWSNIVVRLGAADGLASLEALVVGSRLASLEVASIALLYATLVETSMAETNTRSQVINVLLHMSWDVIFLSGNISMLSRSIFPDIEVSIDEVLDLINWSIKLNPL
jgi:hypothetical protein